MKPKSATHFARLAIITLGAILSLLATGCGRATDTPVGVSITLDTVLQNNLAAVRRDAQRGTVTSTEKIVSITEPQFSVIGRYRASADGHMRIDVFADGTRVYSEGKDEEGAWEWPADAERPENVYHEGAGALNHGIEFNLFTLAELIDRGHSIELVGEEQIRGNRHYVLKLTLSDGFETWRYINADTWLVDISRDNRALHPGIDPTQKDYEIRFDQWQSSDSVTHPGREQTIDRASNEVIQTTLVLHSAYNASREELDLERSFVPDGPPYQ